MAVEYKLLKNELPNGGDHYRARVAYKNVVDLDDVIRTMDERGSTITRADMLAVLEVFHEALLQLLLAGNKVKTPFGVYGLTIKGNFAGPHERFKARRHQLQITAKPGERLEREFARKAEARKTEAVGPSPIAARYTNLAEPEAGGILTPGRMARVTGYRLKFDPADPEQGIFLLPVNTSDQLTRSGPEIRIADVGRNKGRELIFIVPSDLSVGAYRLEVRAVFGQHSLRTGQLDTVLIVPPADDNIVL